MEGSHILTFADACAVVGKYAQSLRKLACESENVALADALGRVLAAPVVADRPQPPFDRSTRDGFAGRAEDFMAGAVRVAGTLRAGEPWTGGRLAPRSCVEIMTGAAAPADADCVVMVEHVQLDGDALRLAAGRQAEPGANIVPAGAEAAQGAVLLEAGTRLRPSGVAMAAACGYARLPVQRRPRVAILATGDELVSVETQPEPHQIRNSNSYALAAQVQAAGGEPWTPTLLPDQAAPIEAAIRAAAASCDLLLLSGGVSMGAYDLVEPALAACGARFVFTGVRMQPGRPLVFGTLGEGALPFFGLPGNPVSTRVCFSVFVEPVLAALAGESAWAPRYVQATLTTAIAAKAGLTRLLPARMRYSADGAMVEVLAWQGSGDMASSARADCFLVIPQGAGALATGDRATVLLTE